MAELNYNLVVEVVKEKLLKFGIQGYSPDEKKSSFYQSGTRFLGLASSSKGKCNDYCNDSPKREKNSVFEGTKTPKLKNTPKSPFASKNKLERKSARKKKKAIENGEDYTNSIFGCELDTMDLCQTSIHDESLVSVPKFVVDACNIIKENITIEGLFRKAGSAQRQQNVKALLESGYSLPTTIHPIDAACLLKQFLRQLPTPLLSSQVHYFMIKCLDLPKDEQLEALALCTLLLPKRNQYLLAFVLEMFSFVDASSQVNLMDSHNLAIVLAPNLIPPSKSSLKNSAEDKLLSSTIDVIQLLIEGSSIMCRPSAKVIIAVEHKEKCQSMENLCEMPSSNVNPKKKRRSASIQRVLIGLRRAVQVGNSAQTPIIPSSPLKTVSTPPILQEGSSNISMDPDIEMKIIEKPIKRKSEGCEALIRSSEEKGFNLPLLESNRPKKKAKMELKSAKAESVPFLNSTCAETLQNTIPYSVANKMCAKNTPQSVKRRHSFRENLDIVFSDEKNAERKYFKNKGSNKKLPSRVQSCQSLSSESSSTNSASPILKPAKRVKSFNFHRSNPKINKVSRTYLKSYETDDQIPNWKLQEISGNFSKDFNDTNMGQMKRFGSSGQVKSPAVVRPVISPGGSRHEKSPGSASLKSISSNQFNMRSPGVVSLGPRGSPDGAESNSRDSWVVKKISCSVSNVSNTQLVFDRYEQIINETKDLDTSPDELLSRRLDKELRIRNRRSNEHRVIRSPSERKIGTIRRRSKELEQNLAKQKSPSECKGSTPKLKGTLMQSPQASLRRGKPNSVKSGLPIVLKSFSYPLENLNKITPPASKTVCIYKRRTYSPVSTDSFLSSVNTSGILSSTYTGPITRRRSSILPLDFNPSLQSPSVNNSYDVSFHSVNEMNSSLTKDIENRAQLEKSCSVPIVSDRDLLETDVEWVAASKFMKDINKDNSSCQMPLEISGNRPSITALKEQKKVTANVQLFSQLQGGQSGGSLSSRRGSRLKHAYHSPLRNIKSDGCSSKLVMDKSPLMSLQHQIPRSKLHDRCIISVSPLKEKNSSSDLVTPKIMSKDRRTSKVKRLESINLPSGLSTPLPPRPFKPPHLITPKIEHNSYETPPRIPPKSHVLSNKKRSPSMKNYR